MHWLWKCIISYLFPASKSWHSRDRAFLDCLRVCYFGQRDNRVDLKNVHVLIRPCSEGLKWMKWERVHSTTIILNKLHISRTSNFLHFTATLHSETLINLDCGIDHRHLDIYWSPCHQGNINETLESRVMIMVLACRILFRYCQWLYQKNPKTFLDAEPNNFTCLISICPSPRTFCVIFFLLGNTVL